jgi:integrase/recombinase XerD
MHQELADFLDYCQIERRLAPLTCSAYKRDVGACVAFLEREGIVAVSEVRPMHLRRFLAEESIRRPAPSSQARTVAALKCFFRFLLENEQIDDDPRPRVADAEEARDASGRARPARARAAAGRDQARRRLEAQA